MNGAAICGGSALCDGGIVIVAHGSNLYTTYILTCYHQCREFMIFFLIGVCIYMRECSGMCVNLGIGC